MAEASTETSAEVVISTDDFALSILMPEIKFARTSPGIDGPGGIKQSLSYNAYYQDDANASAVVVTLTNKNAAY